MAKEEKQLFLDSTIEKTAKIAVVEPTTAGVVALTKVVIRLEAIKANSQYERKDKHEDGTTTTKLVYREIGSYSEEHGDVEFICQDVLGLLQQMLESLQ